MKLTEALGPEAFEELLKREEPAEKPNPAQTREAAEPPALDPEDAITFAEGARILGESWPSINRRVQLHQLHAYDRDGRRWLSRREVSSFEKPDFRRRPRGAHAAGGAIRAAGAAETATLADVVEAVERLTAEVRSMRTVLLMKGL